MRKQSEKNRRLRVLLNKQAKKAASKQPSSTAQTSKPRTKMMNQKFLTYELGKLINPNRVNVEALPKFFKKGLEKNPGQEKVIVEKTDKSLIIDIFNKLLKEKQSASPESTRQAMLQKLKATKKSREEEPLDFKKVIVDVIHTVNDSFKPTYGVEISGPSLKPNISDDKINPQNLTTLPDENKGITSSKDEETGWTKIKALPYTYNPKLDNATTRKEYQEHGVRSSSKKTIKSLLRNKNKNRSVDMSYLNNKGIPKRTSRDNVSVTPMEM